MWLFEKNSFFLDAIQDTPHNFTLPFSSYLVIKKGLALLVKVVKESGPLSCMMFFKFW